MLVATWATSSEGSMPPASGGGLRAPTMQRLRVCLREPHRLLRRRGRLHHDGRELLRRRVWRRNGRLSWLWRLPRLRGGRYDFGRPGYNPGGLGGPASGLGVRSGLGVGSFGPGQRSSPGSLTIPEGGSLIWTDGFMGSGVGGGSLMGAAAGFRARQRPGQRRWQGDCSSRERHSITPRPFGQVDRTDPSGRGDSAPSKIIFCFKIMLLG